MIFRIWHGWTTPENADVYQRLVDGEIVPAIMARGLPGLNQVAVLRRHDPGGEEVEFITVMTFDAWASVVAFAGPGGTTSVVPDKARRVLSRFDEHSQHYQRVGVHTAATAGSGPPPQSWVGPTPERGSEHT